MSIQSLAHVCIKTKDLAATADFYCNALGMRKRFDFLRKGTVIGFYLQAANTTFIEVFHADEVEPVGKQVLSHFCLQTDSLESLRKSLLDRGHAPGAITMGADHTLQFWMKDPNGLDVEFQEYSDRSTQLTGEDVEVNW